MSQQSSSAAGVEWNFEGLYDSLADPRLRNDLENVVEMASDFEAKYRGIMGPGIAPAQLRAALDELEVITRELRKPYYYAHLRYAQDTTNKKAGAVKQMAEEFYVKARHPITFFDLEWNRIDDAAAGKLMDSPALKKYRNYLAAKRLFKPHQLSEAEEKLLQALELSGRTAFVRLFDETMGRTRVNIILDGVERQLPLDGALAMLYDPDRGRRRAAHKAVTAALEGNMDLLTFIFNTLVQHHATEDEFRKYPHPARRRNLENQVDDETVESLKAAVDRDVDMVARYYRLKARLLDIDDLKDYDRYAPITQGRMPCDYEDARRMTLAAYSGFHPRFGEIAARFFDNGWIDAEPRQGKEGGAFAANVSSDHHPYIMLNFTDELSDAMTMAHEMGHGIHQYLAREQGDILMDTSLCMAETASIFGEMLLFTDLVAREQDPRKRLNLLCGKIESMFATVVRQIMMNRFETRLHAARRERGELGAEEIDSIWLEENRWMFGESVEMTPEYGKWWSYVLHFVHYPFYTYAYAFGELMVLSLFDQYRAEGDAFKEKYIRMLTAGGSASPKELMAVMGQDITHPEFWQRGMAIIGRMVEQAEKEAGELGY